MAYQAWLDQGDAPEADWTSYLLRRMSRGEIGDGGEGLFLDLVALFQPYACRPGLCTPGRRTAQARSCCADLTVSVTRQEQAAITAALPEVAEQMAGDARWSSGAPTLFEHDTLRRAQRRCIFAIEAPQGLSCGLHRAEHAGSLARGTLKPMPCRLFPLAVVDLGDGRALLTAVHRTTAARLASRPARVFPCLAPDAPPLFESERDTLTSVFGAKVYRRIAKAWRERDAPAG